MRILILAAHYEVTGARYITRAFEQLGHDVRHVGIPAQLKNAWGVDIAPRYRWTPDTLTNEWSPDLIVVADTEPTTSDVCQFYRVKFPNAAVVVWSNDNHVRNMRHIPADHYFLAHYHGQAQPVMYNDETWLPCATDTNLFPPSPIPYEQRPYDVCCVGVMYPRRAELVNLLREEGFKVFAATGLVYDEYRIAYQNAKLSLCVSAAGDVAQRIFETLGMGCVALTDPLRDLSDGYTNPQLKLSGFSVYWTDRELVERTREFLTAERSTAEAASKATPSQIHAQHTWAHRAMVVIKWYKDNIQQKELPSG